MDVNAVTGTFTVPDGVEVTGRGTLDSAFDVSGLAVASIAAAGNAVAELAERLGGVRGAVTVDRDLASLWFGMSFRPDGWDLPPAWDAIAGDYPCADGWIRLHTNAPHHRAAALAVLGLPVDAPRDEVAAATASRAGEELEAAIVTANGCAALMRTHPQWEAHPQGAAVASEPLVAWGAGHTVMDDGGTRERARLATAARPLAGVRVLDLTRVIAGPVATRFLAMYGAEVLRIDPPDWHEPALEPEMTVGKTCARLDLKTTDGIARLHELLAGADLFVHGYRPDALDRLGLGADALAGRYPGLVDVALDAYGWSGPWAARRGFDSLVQMSCGIAQAGMDHYGSDAPHPLPVQALDHATGYLVAAAAVHAWRERLDGSVRSSRLSLARTAVELLRTGPSTLAGEGGGTPDGDAGRAAAEAVTAPVPPSPPDDWPAEQTAWGPGRRLPWPVDVPGVEAGTSLPARGYGSAPAKWPSTSGD
ncbi:CoA transferase [Specibacter cremeus]|uniref:CoA transferase n=1 Tax=Specibacter cremeus TaxID=1629051 RepID=UPI000F796BDA|nr:CoA transferase [Specibacter cremeus]